MGHTPGPWTIRGPSPGGTEMDDGGDYAILDGQRHIIGEAIHRTSTNGYEDAEANARLWAAAPDLLAACEAILTAVEDDPSLQEQLVIAHFGTAMPFASALKLVSTAIARAKGDK